MQNAVRCRRSRSLLRRPRRCRLQAQTRKPMKLTLNFLAGGPQAGFMYAKKLGYYKDAGIDLTIEEGKGSATTAQQVATGQTDVGFADAPAAMQIRSKGAPREDHRADPADQRLRDHLDRGLGHQARRRTSSASGSPCSREPRRRRCSTRSSRRTRSTRRSSTSSTSIPAAFVGALLEKKVDAILAGADFQSVQMRDRGFKVNDILYRDVGVPTVGLVDHRPRRPARRPIPISTGSSSRRASRAGTRRARIPTPPPPRSSSNSRPRPRNRS